MKHFLQGKSEELKSFFLKWGGTIGGFSFDISVFFRMLLFIRLCGNVFFSFRANSSSECHYRRLLPRMEDPRAIDSVGDCGAEGEGNEGEGNEGND